MLANGGPITTVGTSFTSIAGTGVAVNLIEQARQGGIAGLDVRAAVASLVNPDSIRTILGSIVGGTVMAAVAGSLPMTGTPAVLVRLGAGVVGATLGGHIASRGKLPTWDDWKRLPVTTFGAVAGTKVGMGAGPPGMFAGSIAGMYFGDWLADSIVGKRAPDFSESPAGQRPARVRPVSPPAAPGIGESDLRNSAQQVPLQARSEIPVR